MGVNFHNFIVFSYNNHWYISKFNNIFEKLRIALKFSQVAKILYYI